RGGVWAEMPLGEIPGDRVLGEIEKLLLKARRPSIGLALMKDWEMLGETAPQLLPLGATPQDPQWHPEGDVWTHTLQVVDEAAGLRDDLCSDRPRALTVMLAALLHDVGKPATTFNDPKDGHVRSPGHEEAGVAAAASLLDRWNRHTLLRSHLRAQGLAPGAH